MEQDNNIPLGLLVDITESAVNTSQDTVLEDDGMPLKDELSVFNDATNTRLSEQSNTKERVQNDGIVTKKPPGKKAFQDLLSEDIKLLDSEEFDFDFDLRSPSNSNHGSPRNNEKVDGDADDDEVYFGPISFKEQCEAVARGAQGDRDHDVKPQSPLSVEQMVELFKEAQTIACQISLRSKPKQSPRNNILKKMGIDIETLDKRIKGIDSNECGKHTGVQRTVSETEAGKKECNKENVSVTLDSPLRRKNTFKVTDSPLKIKALPVIGLSTDKRGLVQFKAKDERPKSCPSSNRMKSPPKRRSAAPASKLAFVRPRDKKLPTKATPRFSPPKKLRVNRLEDAMETCSIKSDTSDSSLCIPIGKRAIPQPKLNRVAKSTDPVFVGHQRTRSNSSASSVGSNVSQSSISSKSSLKQPDGMLSKLKAPMTKLYLPKPVGWQRKTLIANRPQPTSTKPGPIKAIAPVPTKGSKSNEGCVTPVKQDKHAIPKRLMNGDGQGMKTPEKGSGSSLSSCAFSTPGSVQRPASLSSCAFSTPGSVQRPARRSMLPTPSRRASSLNSRLNSTCSSPTSTRSNSSVFDSPVTPARAQGRKPLVQHTPLFVPPPTRKSSGWTPIRKPRLTIEDQVLQCTKRTSTRPAVN